MSMSCITVEAFRSLRRTFFDLDGSPLSFELPPKGNSQDDPLDRFLAREVLTLVPGLTVLEAPGPLTTPDLVSYRPSSLDSRRGEAEILDSATIVGIEVKKLERTRGGTVARASGLDYNTTPPCGKVRVYDAAHQPVDIRGFYLFVCLEEGEGEGTSKLTSLALADGDLLNADFELYLRIVGERQKAIGLGTYRDGADRQRPMLIFANPLGAPELDGYVNLIHRSPSLESETEDLRKVYEIRRTAQAGLAEAFSCYRFRRDVPDDTACELLVDPFPTPEREARTQPRGKFVLPFQIASK